MSWLTIVWPMRALARTTLAAMHLPVWHRNGNAWANPVHATTAARLAGSLRLDLRAGGLLFGRLVAMARTRAAVRRPLRLAENQP